MLKSKLMQLRPGLYGLIVALLIDQRASLGSGLCVPKTA